MAHSRGALAVGVLAVLVVLLSANETALFYTLHKHYARDALEYAMGGLDGRAPWRAFQNRLLGPFAYAAFGRAVGGLLPLPEWVPGDPPADASQATFAAFAGVMILAKNALALVLLLGLTRRAVASLALAALGSVLFVAVSDPLFYVWDFFDVILFTLLAYLIIRGGRVRPLYLGAFALALLNRESALFFGLWPVCAGLARCWLGVARARRHLLVGAALILVAAAWTKLSRDLLFVAAPGGGLDEANALLGNHFVLLDNLAALWANLGSVDVYVNGYVAAMALHGLWLLRAGLRAADAQRLALGLFVLGLLGALMAFARVNETRVFLTYLPLVVFSAAAFARDIRRGLAAAERRFAAAFRR